MKEENTEKEKIMRTKLCLASSTVLHCRNICVKWVNCSCYIKGKSRIENHANALESKQFLKQMPKITFFCDRQSSQPFLTTSPASSDDPVSLDSGIPVYPRQACPRKNTRPSPEILLPPFLHATEQAAGGEGEVVRERKSCGRTVGGRCTRAGRPSR